MGTNWRKKLRNNHRLDKANDLNEKHKSVIYLANEGFVFEKEVLLTSYIHDLIKYNLVEKNYNFSDKFRVDITWRGEYFIEQYIDDNFEPVDSIKEKAKDD